MTTIRSCPSIVIADGSGDDRLRTGRGGVDTRFLDLKLTSSSMFDGMKVVTTCMLGEIDGVPPAWLEPRWSIGQVAARTGVPADTLRYYEHVGAVIPAGRTSGGARRYSDLDVERISCTCWLREAGVPIPTILQFNKLREQGRLGRQGRRALLADYRDELIRRRKQLDASITAVEGKIAKYDRLTGSEQ